jgi:acetyl esterase
MDRELSAWLAALNRGDGPPARELGVAALRAAGQQRAAARPRGPGLPRVEDLRVGGGGLAARLYRPSLDPRPLIVFLHGGMWLMGDLDSHDRTCRRLARAADAAVLAVDYRRGPEAPWPAAVDDALAALRWAGPGAAVAGDSAGGQLAALACLRLRDAGEPLPVAQLLAYPNTDLSLSQPSVAEKGSGWGLDAQDLAWAIGQWLPPGADRGDRRVSPLHAPDLSGLPPTLVVTAEHDPLRDEGDAFAHALASAGTPVRHRCEPGMVHGFLQGLDLLSPAAAAASERFFADAHALVRGG